MLTLESLAYHEGLLRLRKAVQEFSAASIAVAAAAGRMPEDVDDELVATVFGECRAIMAALAQHAPGIIDLFPKE